MNAEELYDQIRLQKLSKEIEKVRQEDKFNDIDYLFKNLNGDIFTYPGMEYFVLDEAGKVDKRSWQGAEKDKKAYVSGCAFLSEIKAEQEADYRKIRNLYNALSRPFIEKLKNFMIIYNTQKREFEIVEANNLHIPGVRYFDSKKEAEEAIKEVGEGNIYSVI